MSATNQIKLRGLQDGFSPPIDFGDFTLTALAPNPNRVQLFQGQTVEKILDEPLDVCQGLRQDANDISIVLVLRHKTLPLNFVLGGDATTVAWPEAIDCWQRIVPSDEDNCFAGVKVSHHGALKNHYPELYSEYCKPEESIAILSVGPDYVDHPHPDVLEFLRQQKIRVCVTCWPKTESNAEDDSLLFFGESESTEILPQLDGYGCSDIEVHIYSDGRVAVTPDECLLRSTAVTPGS